MHRNRLPLFLALALPAAALALPGAANAAEITTPHVSVIGEGEVSVAPDTAILTLAVLREAETAREALDAANVAMADVIAAMKKAGVGPDDLQTGGLSINPQYIYPTPEDRDRERRIVGYQVSNTLTVRVRDIEKVGEILDRAVTLGVNQGGGISFVNDDPDEALDEARRLAVADAISSARTLAAAAGVELGDILELSEQASAPPPMPMGARVMRMEAAAADAVPIEPGENTYRVHVNVTFELDQ